MMRSTLFCVFCLVMTSPVICDCADTDPTCATDKDLAGLLQAAVKVHGSESLAPSPPAYGSDGCSSMEGSDGLSMKESCATKSRCVWKKSEHQYAGMDEMGECKAKPNKEICASITTQGGCGTLMNVNHDNPFCGWIDYNDGGTTPSECKEACHMKSSSKQACNAEAHCFAVGDYMCKTKVFGGSCDQTFPTSGQTCTSSIDSGSSCTAACKDTQVPPQADLWKRPSSSTLSCKDGELTPSKFFCLACHNSVSYDIGICSSPSTGTVQACEDATTYTKCMQTGSLGLGCTWKMKCYFGAGETCGDHNDMGSTTDAEACCTCGGGGSAVAICGARSESDCEGGNSFCSWTLVGCRVKCNMLSSNMDYCKTTQHCQEQSTSLVETNGTDSSTFSTCIDKSLKCSDLDESDCKDTCTWMSNPNGNGISSCFRSCSTYTSQYLCGAQSMTLPSYSTDTSSGSTDTASYSMYSTSSTTTTTTTQPCTGESCHCEWMVATSQCKAKVPACTTLTEQTECVKRMADCMWAPEHAGDEEEDYKCLSQEGIETSCDKGRFLMPSASGNGNTGICLGDCPPGFLDIPGKGQKGQEKGGVCKPCVGKSARRRVQSCSDCSQAGYVAKDNSDECHNVQNTCDPGACCRCAFCMKKVTPAIANCDQVDIASGKYYNPGTMWCGAVTSKIMSCQSASFGCWYRILCSTKCVAQEWKDVFCGKDEDGVPMEDDNECEPDLVQINMLARGHNVTLSASAAALLEDQDESEEEQSQRVSSNSLDESLEGKRTTPGCTTC